VDCTFAIWRDLIETQSFKASKFSVTYKKTKARQCNHLFNNFMVTVFWL